MKNWVNERICLMHALTHLNLSPMRCRGNMLCHTNCPDSSLFFSSMWWNVPLLPVSTDAFPLNDTQFLWKMSSFEDRFEVGGMFYPLSAASGSELLYFCRSMVVIPRDAFSIMVWPQHVPHSCFWLRCVLKQ